MTVKNQRVLEQHTSVSLQHVRTMAWEVMRESSLSLGL